MNYLSRKYILRNSFTPLMAALVLAGCATLPPKDAAPVLDEPVARDLVKLDNGNWPAAGWWKQYGDAQLDQLIDTALANSPSMAVAQARIQQASAEAGVVAAESGASLSANAQVSRQLYSQNYIYPPPLAGSYDTSGILELDFSYDFDFWGRNRSALKAALGQRRAAEAEAAAAASSLSAAVAKSYFQWQVLNAHIANIQQIQGERGKLVELERKRVKAGVTAGESVHPLVADAAAPHQTLTQLETQRDETRYQLQALLGGHSYIGQLAARPLPTVNVGVPADAHLDLLSRRPDIAAARDQVESTLASVESARAAFYPDFSISAFLGLNSLQMGKLLRSSSRDAGITPALHLPLFDAGRLRANLNINRADVTMAVAQYDQTVQTAVADVNDAAVRLGGVEREAPSLQQQLDARQHDLDSAARRVKAGLADQREVLRDRLSVIALQDQELSRHAQALSAQIDLIKALGGGYGTPDLNAKQ
jgi:multidrug efflux system outer membrane protein